MANSNPITIPDKITGSTLTAAEFQQILDALKNGTKDINPLGISGDGTTFIVDSGNSQVDIIGDLDVTGSITASVDINSDIYKVGTSTVLYDNSGDITLTNLDVVTGTAVAAIGTALTSTPNLVTVGTLNTGVIGPQMVLNGVYMTLGSDVDGDTYYRSSNHLVRLGKGTANQVKVMNSGATAPEWVDLTSDYISDVPKITVSATEPTGASLNDIWIDIS